MRTYAFLALLLPLASACYESQCFTEAELGACVPQNVSQLVMQHYAYVSRDCMPLYSQGLHGVNDGLTCVIQSLAWLNHVCRMWFGNKCIVYLGLSGLVHQSCNPTVTVEGIPLDQWIRVNRDKKGDICPLQFQFPGVNKRCAPSP